MGKRAYEYDDEDDEEGATERACKRERKGDEIHTVGEIEPSTRRAPDSAEHTGDHEFEGESQILMGASGTSAAVIDGTPTEGTITGVVPASPTLEQDASA
ncbi:hypothetical protein HAX54_050761 [Datura stramonium]|uniref:Uncharacterized protein n=1 Tax=Datura stramonium TaxID=4076 RepID=A0ABS8WQI6_DATST|nr:hypothetical protein [Datura stramonium]